MELTRNDEALSPVIGTILMVMISVMLGGIIGIYAFGMSSSVQNTRMVATSVIQSGSDILITYQGGQAQPDLASMTIIAPNATTFITVSSSGALSTTGTPVLPEVGSVMVLSGAGTSDQDHVVVIGYFNDGTSQVISDTFV
jgi:archaeal type IV pilus assembly protein PilA